MLLVAHWLGAGRSLTSCGVSASEIDFCMYWLPSSSVFSPVNCRGFVLLPAQVWTAVMCTHAATPDAPLFPLVYPLCQIMIGVVRLESTSRLIPLRLIVCGLLSEVRLTCEQAA